MNETTKTVRVAVWINGSVAWEGEYAGVRNGFVQVREGGRIDEVPVELCRYIDDGGFPVAMA